MRRGSPCYWFGDGEREGNKQTPEDSAKWRHNFCSQTSKTGTLRKWLELGTTDPQLAWEQIVKFAHTNEASKSLPCAVAEYNKAEKKGAQELLDEINYEYDDEMMLSIKSNTRMSYDSLQQLINIMSKEKDEHGVMKPKRVGKYGLLLPKFASLDRVKDLTRMVKEDHGLDLNADTETVTLNFVKLLRQKVEKLGAEHPAIQEGIVLQLLGDGYRHFRRISVINMAVKLLHDEGFDGSPLNLMNTCLWKGDESYESIYERTTKVRADLLRLLKDGLTVDFDDGQGEVTIVVNKVVAGGDMKWILACNGMSGWDFSIWFMQSSKLFKNYTTKYRRKTTRMAFHLAHVEFDDTDFRRHHIISNVVGGTLAKQRGLANGMYILSIGGKSTLDMSNSQVEMALDATPLTLTVVGCIYAHELNGQTTTITLPSKAGFRVLHEKGMKCPGCGKLFANSASLGRDKCTDLPNHRRTHGGHNWHWSPIFKFIELGDHYICTLHLLLRVTGQLWKRLIGVKIVDKKVAEAVTEFLHDVMRVYVPPVKTATKGGKIDLAKTMSFTGAEAVRILEHFGACVDKVPGAADHKVAILNIVGLFINYYNCLNTRVVDNIKTKPLPSELKAPLLEKAKALKKLGETFLEAYITYTDDASVTHYLKSLCREVPEMTKQVDLPAVSGAALEALNQVLKRTNTSRGGGSDPVARLLVMQLATSRIVSAWLEYKGKIRATFYTRVKTERKGTSIKPASAACSFAT